MAGAAGVAGACGVGVGRGRGVSRAVASASGIGGGVIRRWCAGQPGQGSGCEGRGCLAGVLWCDGA